MGEKKIGERSERRGSLGKVKGSGSLETLFVKNKDGGEGGAY